MYATKLSVLATYERLFFVFGWFRHAATAVKLILFPWFTAGLFVTIFQCEPVVFVWDYGRGGTYLDKIKIFQAITVSNAVTDLIILGLPIFPVMSMQISTRRRWLLLGTFLLGLLSFFAAALGVLVNNLVVFSDRVCRQLRDLRLCLNSC